MALETGGGGAAARDEGAAAALSVLIVDDDDFVRDSTRLVLESVGGDGRLSIEEAADGEEALQKLPSHGPFDLVLMDAQMPFMDGFECIRRLRAWEQARVLDGHAPRRARAIAISGNADDPGFLSEALGAGFDEAIVKPLMAARAKSLLAVT